MPNTFLTPSIIAKEALMVLQNNMVMANMVHKDFSSEFAKVGDTINVRKPTTFTAKNFLGAIDIQDATETNVAVKMDRHRDISFQVTSKELTLDIKEFSFQLLAPAMRALAQAVDSDLLNVVAEVPAAQRVAKTASPTNLADLAALGKIFDKNAVPMDTRRLVMSPEHKYTYALQDNLSKVAYAGNGEALRNAELGRIYTLDTYMDQNLPFSVAGTAGTATAFKVTGTKGATTIALSGVTATTGTVKSGDCFILDGYRYYFTADATASAGAIAEVTIDQPLVKAYTAADAYPANKDHSLAFHRNGIAMVTRPLALPMGAARAAVENYNGMGVRVVFGYDQSTKIDTVSLDILYGIKVLDTKLIASLVG